jgi:hypothetical protein
MFNDQVWPRRFIEVWQSSSTRREVAIKLQMSAGAVRQREKRYRKNGIPLKEMETVESWEWLKQYAKDLECKPDPKVVASKPPTKPTKSYFRHESAPAQCRGASSPNNESIIF